MWRRVVQSCFKFEQRGVATTKLPHSNLKQLYFGTSTQKININSFKTQLPLTLTGQFTISIRKMTDTKTPETTMSESGNIGVVKDEFTRQAAVFEEKWNVRMKRSNSEIMEWVMSIVGSIAEDAKALDVASGTGTFARQLAPLCKSVTALDATDAMLKEAERKSAEAGRSIEILCNLCLNREYHISPTPTFDREFR